MSEAFGLYIHIPFCQRKCPYCDFNTYAGLQSLYQETVDALCLEMQRWSSVLGQRPLTSIFLGGGTPTVLDGRQLTQLMMQARAAFTLTADCEITCEANPGAVDQEKFMLLADLGVNRLSLGVQSFQPAELRFLGRIHTVADVYRAVDAARRARFANINLDFIFGLPRQPLANWENTLTQALVLAPEHLSLYSLIVEPQTPLFDWVENGRIEAPDDDLAAEMYEYALARLTQAGYVHYEISNWAKRTPDDEEGVAPQRACRHNLLYWRNGEFLGIGPGAHSHLRVTDAGGLVQSRRWGNRKGVADYVRRLRQRKEVEEFSELIGGRQAMGETMMLGLRLIDEGVNTARFQALHGQEMRAVFGQELTELERSGLIECTASGVRLSSKGVLLGNQVFARFIEV